MLLSEVAYFHPSACCFRLCEWYDSASMDHGCPWTTFSRLSLLLPSLSHLSSTSASICPFLFHSPPIKVKVRVHCLIFGFLCWMWNLVHLILVAEGKCASKSRAIGEYRKMFATRTSRELRRRRRSWWTKWMNRDWSISHITRQSHFASAPYLLLQTYLHFFLNQFWASPKEPRERPSMELLSLLALCILPRFIDQFFFVANSGVGIDGRSFLFAILNFTKTLLVSSSFFSLLFSLPSPSLLFHPPHFSFLPISFQSPNFSSVCSEVLALSPFFSFS